MLGNELLMKDIQAISLDILKKVSDICEEQHLTYFLAYGTLIGAVRHQNYVPWDDDVDIMMPRPDYEKLLDYFRENAVSLMPLQMMNDDTVSGYPYMISRVSDSRYVLDVTNEKSYGIGVFIDIYPLDGLGNDKGVALKLINRGKNLSSLIFLSTRKYFHKGNTKTWVKMLLKFPAFVYAKLCGKKFFSKKSLRLATMNKYEDSRYVGCVIWPTYRERDIYDKVLFEETIMVNFGKYQFRAPKRYDEILTQIYNNYMQLPPEKDRVAHHLYSAYKK